MFLKSLKILNRDSLIREITFHKGINLIVDETPEDLSKTSTGNNVGKTTVIRLVDYCFGGDGKNIYQDTEFKKQPNTFIENFLKENDIIIEIELADDLNDKTSENILIKRNFLQRGKKIQAVNGENITNNNEFDKRLKEFIFKSEVDKPTFRQIISKNIRDEKNKMTNIVKVLSSFASSEVYEALYLFWLGIDTNELDQKQKLSESKKREENFQKRLKKEGELSLVLQQLTFINSKIEELNQEKSLFVINENYGDNINELNKTKAELNSVSTLLSRLKIRRELIIESKEELENEHSNIDASQIKKLYERANSLIPNLQVSFEDTIKFHNDLLNQKLKYITKELPELEVSINQTKIKLKAFQRKESLLTITLKKSGFTEDLELIVIELNKLSEKKGSLEEQKRLWESSIEKLRNIETELKTINEGINSGDELIQSRITLFNKYFSDLSNQLYGEYYLLSTQKTEKGYDLIVTNIEGNPSTGKKKGQIAAFDFAYMKFADSLDINCLHFVMHDQLENIHDNQLNTIVDVANQLNGQYIVPILRDKVPENIDISKFEVISLSQIDKLFRI
ncbi:MAG: DUF2326 domain-containing protein [Bacteroidetes bacterium]|jgi:uncharacterized protein YydD (DUF2326 family)|nr:DUF2326 domain-containing protein [Bacteroidota bacterium]MBT7143665.1 DUF2326 domain-containing protein [Bacteroidota bacterium]MBT7492864.1 DUF2326 domain-containing protein [Bacteroidota bacterium]